MKKILFIATFLSALFLSEINAQKLSSIHQKKVNDLFKTNKVVYFKFPVNSMQEIAPLAKVISIDSNKGSMVFAHATKDGFSKFIVKNYAYTVLPSPKAKIKVKPKAVKVKK